MSKHRAVVIGGGFAGLSAACFLARDGYAVTLLEKNSTVGGRCRQMHRGDYVFDMGPSWYWMPDVFERFFAQFGKKVSYYYELQRLDPSYRVYFGQNDFWDIPANAKNLEALLEDEEKGAGTAFQKFMKEAAYKYEVGMKDLVQLPSLSIMEFADMRILKGLFQLQLLQSMRGHIHGLFKSPKIRMLMEFPVLFLGATPANIPALYSLMNYADIELGTWYPKGGMYKIVEAMTSLAKELGVEIKTESEVRDMDFHQKRISKVFTRDESYDADVVVAGADYHHIEQDILGPERANYTEKYWESRIMAPSSLLYYVGWRGDASAIPHHTLFFDQNFDRHAESIYTHPAWPDAPLFYVSRTSATDDHVAPAGCENLFFLIPTAPGLEDTDEVRQQYWNKIVARMRDLAGIDLSSGIEVYETYAYRDFINDYHAYKGNAYGLANTLSQTAILKPSIKSKKVKNLYYTGQLTVPGPGVPPSIISGQVVAGVIHKDLKGN